MIVSFKDILDILCVALLLYGGYRLLRKSGAVNLFARFQLRRVDVAGVSAGVVLGYLCDSVGLDRGYFRAGDKRGSDSHHRDISRGDTVVLLSVGFALQRLANASSARG